jgi:hypothetical protein
VGSDISFDLELVERYACEVWAFDPTPGVIDWVADQGVPESWHFEPVGLWDSAGTIPFYVPSDPRYGSLSATNIHGTDNYEAA